jgi:4-amino-4-deoxychorismate lyase
LEQVLAADSARRCRTDEALMLDQEDRVVSVSAGNLYLYCGGVLLTPRLERCGIAGTVRAELLEKLAPALGIPTREANLGLEELATADAVLYSNSLVGFRSVATWGERHWADHSLADTLRQALAEAAL